MKLHADRVDIAAICWALAFAAIGLGLLLVSGLGFFSLLLIGVLLAAACSYAELTLDLPLLRWTAARVYGSDAYAAEPAAARAALRKAVTPQLRVGRWCGLACAVVGLGGVLWPL